MLKCIANKKAVDFTVASLRCTQVRTFHNSNFSCNLLPSFKCNSLEEFTMSLKSTIAQLSLAVAFVAVSAALLL
jgi:hypothetical protein